MSSGLPASRKPNAPKKSRQEKLASIAEWDEIIRRYPPGDRASLVRQVAMMLVSNGFVVYQLITGRMTPLHLVLLVAIEAVLLTTLAYLQSLTVPAAARKPSDQTVGQRLFALGFGLFWLTAVYALVFAAFLRSGDEIAALVRHPWATLVEAGLLWPLGVTLAAALLDAFNDASYFAEHGGAFLSTPGLNGVARWLTLFLGGIPFFIPLAAVGGLISIVVKKLERRFDPSDPEAKLVLLVVPLMGIGLFSVMGGLIKAGLSGWAIGYTSAKFVSELFILCIPVIAVKAKAEETAAL